MSDIYDSYRTDKVTFDISESTTISTVANILGYQVIGIIVPTGWTAANVTFQIDPGIAPQAYHAVTGLTLTTPTANEVTYLNTGAAAPFVIPILVGANIKLVSSTAQLTSDKEVILLMQRLP